MRWTFNNWIVMEDDSTNCQVHFIQMTVGIAICWYEWDPSRRKAAQRGLWRQNHAWAKCRRMAPQKGKEADGPRHQRVCTFVFVYDTWSYWLALVMVIPVDLQLNCSIIYLYRDLKAEEDSEEDQAESDVRQQLLSIPDLPPSLLPPPPGGWKVKVNTEWGWKISTL